MLTLLCTTGTAAPVAVVLIESATGHVWLAKSKTFGQADGSELIAVSPVAGNSPNMVGVGVAQVPDFPDSRVTGQYVGTVHPAAGGLAVGTFAVTPNTTVVRIAVTVVQ